MGKSNFIQEFKAFAIKGNVVDMAVGVIIGGHSVRSLHRWFPTSSCLPSATSSAG